MLSKHDKKILDMVEDGKISHREAIAELDALVMTHDQLYEYMVENGYSLNFMKKSYCSDNDTSKKVFNQTDSVS